ncbi:YaaC family protein [Nonomuraea sp. NPDC049400]|uniref:YaaC family protein n=1 Tax=Nonomuraea sp. NPDC049400 TaxID=3364352 RepID=UPI00378EF2BD
MTAASTVFRNLRALRHDPPGYAKQGARRTTFQSALEQCEQFLTAAGIAGYATRPVQLFYALSQAGRAIVAASPHVGNQGWRVSGHGLTANTNALLAADVTVTATKAGLFPAVASALNVEALVPDEPVALRELWPLLPETAHVPLTDDALLPVLLFFPHGWPEVDTFSHAEVSWIPHRVKDLYGADHVRVKEHLDHYPALKDSALQVSHPMGGLRWDRAGPGLTLEVEWRSGSPPLMLPDQRTLGDLGVACYRSADDCVLTPAVGSMSTGLHPFLALWAILLALSSLARYEPAAWSKMIDIDRSAEANAIEHLLEEATTAVPAAAFYLLSTFEGPHLGPRNEPQNSPA